MTAVETSEFGRLIFYKGKISDKDVVVVQCGVGKVNAALCTQLLVDHFQIDCIINVGVAGGVAKGLYVGDIVISKDAVQYDVDASAFGHPRGEIPNMDMTYFPADERLIALAKEAAASVGNAALAGRIMTGDRGVASKAIKDELTEAFGGACVEMESGAIAQTAFINDLPYVVIRSISDNADDSAPETYENSLDLSVRHASEMVLKMVEQY